MAAFTCLNRRLRQGLLILISFIVVSYSFPASAKEIVTIGVLAKRGTDKTLQRWLPTANYLSEQLPQYQFYIKPLGFDEIDAAVNDDAVDFILVNSGMYVGLEQRYSASRILTMKNRLNQTASAIFGGVIFTRADRTDLNHLEDAIDKRFIAVDPSSLGGFQMAWRELKHSGIDPYNDLAKLEFAGTHDDVVFAILNAEGDIGTVRTDTLERMAAEGKIKLDDIKVFKPTIQQNGHHDFAYLHSTQLYPEWPMAKLEKTPLLLAEQVARTLMDMPATSPAAIASNTAGWTIPLSYQPVHDLFKELELPPYLPKEITIHDFIAQNRLMVSLLFIGFIIISTLLISIYRKNVNLLKTQSELQKANQAKSEFLSSMSHELRTPLNSVLGFAQLMDGDAKSPLNEAQQTYLQFIINSGKHLLTLINDVLDLSAIEAGKIEVSIEPVNLKDVIHDTLTLTTAMAEKNHLHIQVLSSENLQVYADYTKLKQILLNLCGNAIKYNKQNGTVSINWFKTDDDQVRISVTDTGIGIDPQNQKKMFSAFNRFGYENSAIEGTGIGLLVTKELVELMQGNIGFHSEPNVGSTFWFELPCAPSQKHQNDDVEAELNNENKSVSEQTLVPDFDLKHILYIEDNPANQQLVDSFFQAYEQLRLEIAADAEIGALKIRQFDYDLILMDIHLPGMDGKQLTEQLRKDPDFNTIPIVAVTAAAMSNDIEAGRELFDDYLTKPLDFEHLKAILTKYLQ